MAVAHSPLLELIDFLAAGSTPEALINFWPSSAVENRISDLLMRRQEGRLPPAEASELDDFLQLEHILITAKARDVNQTA